MSEAILLPDVNREFPGLSDRLALQGDVESLRLQLSDVNQQLAIERDLAQDVHRTRSLAIVTSPALRLVYDIDNTDNLVRRPASSDDLLISAFMQPVKAKKLPAGMASTTAKRLRIETHPDIGGDEDTAKQVSQALEEAERDEAYSIASALLTAPLLETVDSAELRLEKYTFSLALDAVAPHFGSVEEAENSAQAEIEGAEWRVRASAVFKTLGLLIGDEKQWSRFLESIVRDNKLMLINMVNRLIPQLQSLQERIAKGKPVAAGSLNIDAIDAIFERIWSTLNKKDRMFPYSPPYHNWLEILLPAMQMLDPGQVPGEEYTDFQPPIRIVRPSEPIPNKNRSIPYGISKLNKSTQYINSNSYFQDDIYNENNNY